MNSSNTKKKTYDKIRLMFTTIHESSAIKAIRYRPDIKKLYVTFTSGRTYEYEGVTPFIWREFINAESAGGFFNWNIRDYYPYRLIA